MNDAIIKFGIFLMLFFVWVCSFWAVLRLDTIIQKLDAIEQTLKNQEGGRA